MERLTLQQAIVLTGFTGNIFCPMEHYHRDAEKRLGRPIFTHEFGSEKLAARLKELYQEDFLAMLPAECGVSTKQQGG